MRSETRRSGLLITGNRSLLIWKFMMVYLIGSTLLRIVFLVWQREDVPWMLPELLRTMVTGLLFDIGTYFYIALPGILYTSLVPDRFIGTIADKMFTYIFFSLTICIIVFTFFAEIAFWEEFKTRFNFIAVDYLIYTYEVINNINESYPLWLLVPVVFAIAFLILYYLKRTQVFHTIFTSTASLSERSTLFLTAMAGIAFFMSFITNSDAEWSSNRYLNEASKSGIYSFFAAFRNNRMPYKQFYTSLADDTAFGIVRSALIDRNTGSKQSQFSIRRQIGTTGVQYEKPNVIVIMMESMSADFMAEFGNRKQLTPGLDKLAHNSIFFSDMYATGTRTVRGMEAITLSIPPTPGQSIVKRPDNHGLYTVGSVFRKKGYTNNFFYGGDGYFDNMNSYFGGNGFTIYDRGRGSVLNDNIKTLRHTIADTEVTFENAWGVCDGDLYNKMLATADEQYKDGIPFFNFVMTTSNHRPYTYPDNSIDIPSGTSRAGAVKYADYALDRMLRQAAGKPWFDNTVFVIVADHCASSAGKDEIDIANYHIPAFIYNLRQVSNRKVNNQCSQIDIFPTLFSLLGWDYESNFFGRDVLAQNFKEKAFLGTYIKLAFMQQDKVIILSEQKKQHYYAWNRVNNALLPLPMQTDFSNQAAAWYQVADYLYTSHLLDE